MQVLFKFFFLITGNYGDHLKKAKEKIRKLDNIVEIVESLII